MLANDWVHVNAGLSVAIIGVVLAATIAASVWQKSAPKPPPQRQRQPPPNPL